MSKRELRCISSFMWRLRVRMLSAHCRSSYERSQSEDNYVGIKARLYGRRSAMRCFRCANTHVSRVFLSSSV